MSKTSEQKALEAYPINKLYNEQCMMHEDVNLQYRIGYEEGYDKALIDIEKQVEESIIEKSNGEVTIEDLVAYNQGFKAGRELTKQDFMEKAEDAISMISRHYVGEDYTFDQIWEQFKNYMQDESEN